MKKIGFNICLILGTIFGLLLLFFPHISFMFADYNQSYISSQYDEQLGKLQQEDRQKMLDAAYQYNLRLNGETIEDPFIVGSGMVQPEDYLEQLNINGTMGHIKIPKIKVDIPIYHGTSDEVLNKGAGHLEGSSLPIGGEGNHTVITGHTGLSSAKMFTELTNLEKNDEFFLYIMGETLAYKIDQIKVVEPSNTDDLKPVLNHDYATLITCTPYGINSHRLIVRGTRVPYSPQQIEEQIRGAKTTVSLETLLLLSSLTALLVLIVLTIVLARKTKRAIRRKKRLAHARNIAAYPNRTSGRTYSKPPKNHIKYGGTR